MKSMVEEKQGQDVGGGDLTLRVSAAGGHGSQDDVPIAKSSEDDRDGFGMLTVDDALEALEFGIFQTLLLVYAGMAWAAEAMEMMLLSFIGPAVQSFWGLTSTQESIITSVVFAGMMVGAYSWGVLSDLKGRRCGFFVTATLTFCAGIASAFAPNYYALLLLRGLVGVGLAGGPVISSWFLEFIPTPNRGLWMVITSVFWTFGTVTEAILAWAVMPTLGWRWLLGFSSLPLLVLLVFYPFMPESPRYLVAKGYTDDAQKILQNMAWLNKKQLPAGKLVSQSNNETIEMGNHGDLSIAEATHLLQENIGSNKEKLQGSSVIWEALNTFWKLFSPTMVRPTLLLWLIFFANAFTYYGLVLLTSQLSGGVNGCNHSTKGASSSGVKANNLYRDVLVTSFAELPGLIVTAAVVDRYGRKSSMAGLFLLCGAFLLPLLQPLPENVTTFLLFGARACISATFTIVFIYAPEVYPTNMRTTGFGSASSFARIGGVLCPLVAVDLINRCHQSLAVTLFVAVPVLASLAVFFLPVETKGRALTDNVENSNL